MHKFNPSCAGYSILHAPYGEQTSFIVMEFVNIIVTAVHDVA